MKNSLEINRKFQQIKTPAYPDVSVTNARLSSVTENTQPSVTTATTMDMDATSSPSDPTEVTTSSPPMMIKDNTTGTLYISKSDDQTQSNATSSSEETLNDSDDDAYIIPIKVILHAEHVHQSSDDNGTFLKFNYILMQTNDTSYHGHFESDEHADRLKLLRTENVTFSTTAEPDVDSMPTSSVSPTMPVMDVLVDENGEQYEQINERTVVNDEGVVVSQYNEIAWKRRNDQEMYTQLRLSDEEIVEADRAMSSESDQENDRHYSKILPWIHYYL